MTLTVEMTWECRYCGLETPDPVEHLRRVHGTTIEQVMADLDRQEKQEHGMALLLLLMGEIHVCPTCGQSLGE